MALVKRPECVQQLLDRAFPLVVFIIWAALGCGKTQDKRSMADQVVSPSAAQADARDDSPTAVRRRFQQLLDQNIKRISPRLKQEWRGTGSNAAYTYHAEFLTADYDIRRTDSIVSPYAATASFLIRWYGRHNDSGSADIQAIVCNYAYTDGEWLLKDTHRKVEGHYEDDAEVIEWIRRLFAD